MIKHIKKNITGFLWLLKFGAIINIYFLFYTLIHPLSKLNLSIILPAQILFTVSAFRCLFPNRYTNNAVLHDTIFSSIFFTRFIATFSEVAYIYLFSYIIRLLNFNGVYWIYLLSYLMIIEVIISQIFVWIAIMTKRLKFYFYEEISWGVIFSANTIASAYLYITVDKLGHNEILIILNCIFGVFYLPWQFIHLKSLWNDSLKNRYINKPPITFILLRKGLYQSIYNRKKTSNYSDWGGILGISWMMGYWATIIPMWVYFMLIILIY